MTYDLTDLELSVEDRDAQLADLRQNAPVHRDDENGWWLITRHEDIVRVSRDTQAFSSASGVTYFPGVPLALITSDPPDHTRMRRLVSRQFTPRMVNAWRELARDMSSTGIAHMLEAGGGDFVEEVAVPTTLSVIMRMLGLEPDQTDDIRRWSDAMMAASGRTDDPAYTGPAVEAALAWDAHLSAHVEDKIARPSDDLLSLLAAEPDEALAFDELKAFALVLFVAGNETTRHTSSFGVQLFAEHRDQAARLRGDSDGVARAIPEVLRWSSVIRSMARTTTQQVEVAGVQIGEGEVVNMIYPSANRDEQVFDRPFEFDTTRDPNPHLAFGIGTHYCLGANLAQLQLETILGQWLDRATDYEVVEVEEFNTGMVTGLEKLVVEF